MMNKQKIVPLLFVLSVCVAFCFSLFYFNRIRWPFYFAVFFSLCGIIQDRHELKADKWLPLAMIGYAIGRFLWLDWIGTPQDILELSRYHAYWGVAKFTIWAAPMVFYAFNLSKRKILPNWIVPAMFICSSLIMSMLAFREHWLLNLDRVVIGYDSSTITAYVITMVHLLALHQVCLITKFGKNKWVLPLTSILLILALQYVSILFTGTRSAIILYPIFVFYMLFSTYKSSGWKRLLFGVGIAVSVVLTMSYHDIIKPRFADFKNDVASYKSQPEVVTSIGARISMWKAALYATRSRPFGEGFNQREALIRKAVSEGQLNGQVLTFIKIHLHSDLLDTLSLQGILGGGLLLLLYAALARQALLMSSPARTALVQVCGALVAFGCCDVLLLWSRIVIPVLLCIVLIGCAYPNETKLDAA